MRLIETYNWETDDALAHAIFLLKQEESLYYVRKITRSVDRRSG